MAASTGSPILAECAKQLIPGLIEYIAKMAPFVHEGSLSEAQANSIAEVWKAFSAFFAATPDANRVRLLGVFLPTVALLLSPTSTSPTNMQTAAQLLSYATTSPAAFKDAAAKLDAPTRELLEQTLRRVVGGTTSPMVSAAAKPQISLRSF